METAGTGADEMQQEMVADSGTDLDGMAAVLAACLDQNQVFVPFDIVEMNEAL